MDALEHRRLLLHDRVERRMFADPKLGGDLLLLALALGRCSREQGRCQGKWNEVASTVGWPLRKLRLVLSTDRPRYQPPTVPGGERRRCEAAMVRRAGPCGQPDSPRLRIRECSTIDGTHRLRFFCTRHADQAEAARARLPLPSNCPTPAANAGGVLERYFSGDWDTIWRWAEPTWTPPPDRPPDRRPKLQLLLGGLTEEPVS